jgi:hypothetical protein
VAEPSHELALLEWLKILVGVAVTAIGSAWGWWRGNQQRIYAKIDAVEAEMAKKLEQINETSSNNHTKLAVMESTQTNHQHQLNAIGEDTRDIRGKVDQLVMAMLNHRQ